MTQHQEKNEPFKELGGYQQIIDGIVAEGDKVTFDGADGSRICLPADIEIGLSVEEVSEIYGIPVNVYRKLRVFRQGDIDHGQEIPILDSPVPFVDRQGNPLPCATEVGTPGGMVSELQDYRNFIPQDSDERKKAPMFRGLLGYFPAALFEVARHSLDSDQKHNPGNVNGPHWSRKKSYDHQDCIVRHLIDAGDVGTPNRLEHLRALAWRSLAVLQEECERQGAKPGVSSR